MTHCHDFFRKWKREGNFCGLRKQDAREMDSYLTLVERISNEKTGLNADLVFDKFTAGAARPIIRCKDAEIETKALNYVIACLKRGEDVTGGDLQATVNGLMGKDPKPERTQMRTPEPAPVKESLTTEAPPVTLADQIRKRDLDTTTTHQAPAEKHVAAAKVTINPVIVPDTYRESPFKTGSQVKAGIAGEMFPDHIVDANKMISPPALTAEEQKKADRQHRIELAEELVDYIKRGMPEMVRDILKEHPSWNTADVLYFGVQVLHERKGKV